METNDVRQQLEKERERLDGMKVSMDADGLHSESETESLGELSSLSQHQADLGTETFEREKDLSILESIEAELTEVEHALKRLDDGTYGKCEACGNPIGDERLAAMPATRFCVDDQSLAEREARIPSGE